MGWTAANKVEVNFKGNSWRCPYNTNRSKVGLKNRGSEEAFGTVLFDGTATYVPGVSRHTSAGTRVYNPDFIGSNRVESDASGNAVATRVYDAYGNHTASTGSPSSPFGFAGAFGYQEDGDSGLKLLGHRLYDPTAGRFITRDPAQSGSNWYAYCENNPLRAVDVTGANPIELQLCEIELAEAAADADAVGAPALDSPPFPIPDGSPAPEPGSGCFAFFSRALTALLASLGLKSCKPAGQWDGIRPSKIPSDWKEAQNRDQRKGPQGKWTAKPSVKGKPTEVRIDVNNPEHGPAGQHHVHVTILGEPVNWFGVRVPGTPANDPSIHIPYEDWKKWPHWHSPSRAFNGSYAMPQAAGAY